MYHFSKDILQEQECEVLVVGGGIAGISAAIASSRTGANTMLIEQYSVLGGAQGIGAFCGETKGQGEIFDEIIDGLGKLNAIESYKPYKEREARPFDNEVLKFVLQEMIRKENIDLLLHTKMVAVDVKDNSIEGVIIHNPSGLQVIEPQVVIDATGDGFVAYEGGFPCNKGRQSDNKTLPMSLMFFLRDICKKPDSILPSGLKEYTPEDVPMVSIWPEPDGKVGIKLKVIGYDSTNGRSFSNAELFARREMMAINYYLQHYPNRMGQSPEKVFLENYKFDYASMQIGIREGWRIKGEYVLSVDDVKNGRKFKDGIALGRFYLDALSPDSDKREYMLTKEDLQVPPYHIPYRSLVPKDSKNLLVAGRCFSCNQLALSSARVMTTASMMGQAAGRAAAMMVDNNKLPLEINVNQLKKELSNHGAVL